MKTKGRLVRCILVLILLTYLAVLSPSVLNAGEVRTVEGLIESVTYDSIEVRGKYYNISDVLLLNSSGKKVSKDQLRTGKKVEIFFKDDRITSILIHEYMVE